MTTAELVVFVGLPALALTLLLYADVFARGLNGINYELSRLFRRRLGKAMRRPDA